MTTPPFSPAALGQAALVGWLDRLDAALEAAEFRLPLPDRDEQRAEHADLTRAVRENARPRPRARKKPAVVFFGPSGSGKSSLLSGLAGRPVAKPGPVRPTTTRPLVWADRDDRELHELVDSLHERAGPVDTVVADDELSRSLTLVDAPPFHVTGESGRPVAEELLAAADLGVFVSSAGRYADAEAWRFTHRAHARGLPLLFVLNRIPADAPADGGAVADYAERLAKEGLLPEPEPARLLVIREQQPDPAHHGIPSESAAGLRETLLRLSDPELAAELAEHAMRGLLSGLAARSHALAARLETEADAIEALRAEVDVAYAASADELAGRLAAGGAAGMAGWPAVRDHLVALVSRAAGTAAQATADVWDRAAVGRRLLEGEGESLWRPGPQTPGYAADRLDSWAEAVDGAAADRHPGRLASRRRERLAAAIRTAALDPGADPHRLFGRLAKADGADLAAWAHGSLTGEMRGVLAADAARFAEFAGDADDVRWRAGALATAAVADR